MSTYDPSDFISIDVPLSLNDKGLWFSKAGYLAPKDMTTQHIVSVLNKCDLCSATRKVFKDELRSRDQLPHNFLSSEERFELLEREIAELKIRVDKFLGQPK